MPRMPGGRRIWLLLILLLALNWWFASTLPDHSRRLTTSYTFFRSQVDAGNVAEVTLARRHDPGRLQEGGHDPTGKDEKAFTQFQTERPTFVDDGLGDAARGEGRDGQRQAARRRPGAV